MADLLLIYYDNLQEGLWFRALHQGLADAELRPITGATTQNPSLTEVLAYDRPDVILTHGERAILIVERTAEVPSGHNVGQRFARMAAAAQCHVPLVYFCPYAARKHGGATEGPRYMNLRLFYSLDKMAEIEGSSVETINWPVDEHYEVVQNATKDDRMRAYLGTFFRLYDAGGVDTVNRSMKDSGFHREQTHERQEFIRREIRRREQYDAPAASVMIGNIQQLVPLRNVAEAGRLPHPEIVLYKVGMKYIRSDPYTGMGMLYEYLYAGGASHTTRTRSFVFHFPNISVAMWRNAASRDRKDIRLFSKVADGILFRDGFLRTDQLLPAARPPS